MSEEKQLYGADLVVDSLINHDVDYVFGIPGAKIDRVFSTLEDKGRELIVARHEQNASFLSPFVLLFSLKPGIFFFSSLPLFFSLFPFSSPSLSFFLFSPFFLSLLFLPFPPLLSKS